MCFLVVGQCPLMTSLQNWQRYMGIAHKMESFNKNYFWSLIISEQNVSQHFSFLSFSHMHTHMLQRVFGSTCFPKMTKHKKFGSHFWVRLRIFHHVLIFAYTPTHTRYKCIIKGISWYFPNCCEWNLTIAFLIIMVFYLILHVNLVENGEWKSVIVIQTMQLKRKTISKATLFSHEFSLFRVDNFIDLFSELNLFLF